MFEVAILKNETNTDHQYWMLALDKKSELIKYDVIDLTKSDWLKQLQKKNYDILLTRAPGVTSYFKQLYDERVYIIHSQLKKNMYPSLDELFIYENKRLLSYWLAANKIPHPSTDVFYHKSEAMHFANTTRYPFVAKTSIGGSGSGVKIIKTKASAKKYIERAFSNKGIGRRWWPNFDKSDLGSRLKKRLLNLNESINHFKHKRHEVKSDFQKNFVIFQEFVEIVDEWRCVYIDGNYFGHKKEKRGELISGGGGIVWDYPDEKLLNFLKDVVTRGKLEATSLDVLVTNTGQFLINEIQAFFGFIHPDVQMKVDEKPGKFIFNKGKWEFVEGIFNSNNSYDLRVEHILEMLSKNPQKNSSKK